MTRVVLDTNTLVSGLGWGGVPGAVVDAGLASRFDIATSPPLLAELRRVLEAARAGEADVIVTGDADLLDLGPVGGIRVLTASDLLAELRR